MSGMGIASASWPVRGIVIARQANAQIPCDKLSDALTRNNTGRALDQNGIIPGAQSWYSTHMSKPTKQTELRSRVLRLAREMRAKGFHTLSADLIAERLGRPLSKAERRAHIMAMDTVGDRNALADTMQRHEGRIADGAMVKYAIAHPFRDNQHSPKTIPVMVNGRKVYRPVRIGGMRPLPKGEYMVKADLTGRGVDPDAPKAFDGSEDMKYAPIRALQGDREYQRIRTIADAPVIQSMSPTGHDVRDAIERTRPTKLNRKEAWDTEYKSK